MKGKAVRLVEIQFKKLPVSQICFWAARRPRAQPGKRLESSFPEKVKQRVSGLKNSRTRYHFFFFKRGNEKLKHKRKFLRKKKFNERAKVKLNRKFRQ